MIAGCGEVVGIWVCFADAAGAGRTERSAAELPTRPMVPLR